MNARDTSYDEATLQALRDPQEAAAYLEAVIELDDPAALLVALRKVARAHGMAEVAPRAELGEKTLFRALSESGDPTLDDSAQGAGRGGVAAERAAGLIQRRG